MKQDKLSKVLRIVARVLSLPFFAITTFIYMLMSWVKIMIGFAVYGGEFIPYPDASTRKTIAGVFDALVSLKEGDDEPQAKEKGLYRKLRDTDDKEYFSRKDSRGEVDRNNKEYRIVGEFMITKPIVPSHSNGANLVMWTNTTRLINSIVLLPAEYVSPPQSGACIARWVEHKHVDGIVYTLTPVSHLMRVAKEIPSGTKIDIAV